MVFVRVVLDKELLKRVDRAAKRHKVNRSALIRQVLQEYMKRLHTLDLEERDRRRYGAQPQRVEEYGVWEEAAAWPEY
jgi:metal-responsive CopG/Arc/MetJ family transcriptional regulator